MVSDTPQIIYKICRRDEWSVAERERLFRGSPDDLRDGFIHFSTAAQCPGTFEKEFASEPGLVLVAGLIVVFGGLGIIVQTFIAQFDSLSEQVTGGINEIVSPVLTT